MINAGYHVEVNLNGPCEQHVPATFVLCNKLEIYRTHLRKV